MEILLVRNLVSTMTNQGGIMLFIQIILVILYASVTVYSPNQTVILRTDYSCKYIYYKFIFINKSRKIENIV